MKFEELAEEDNRGSYILMCYYCGYLLSLYLGVTLEQPMESGSPVRLSPADKSEVASGEQLTSCPVQAGEDNEVCICKLVESYYYNDSL